ncbi:MAG: carbohydrate kinase family protein [Spirochaetales bacterium]|nr:carbohydrate kinase family protein [Spirochaetales bacterium]
MKINAIGCSLIDNLYSPVDFSSEGYRKWSAENGTKNGLITGGLIFGDELEASSGTAYNDILKEIIGDLKPDKNIGGPAVVALIHMAQILDNEKHQLGFYGSRGNDLNGRFITEKLKSFGIDASGYITVEGKTPFTDVLSDPSYNDNNGERTFINYLGAAGNISGRTLPESFFNADILIFGGTGLTPGIHDDLSLLLKKGRERGCINCVNTVYDFRNQKKAPDKRWPLVEKDQDFKLINLLIADNEEALRISGKSTKKDAAAFFLDMGAAAGVITHGAEDFICFSNGSLFSEKGLFTMPVSAESGRKMRKTSAAVADTTGCGDNFAGGLYASMTGQLMGTKPSLKKAASFGAVSGGFAGLYRGGVYYEKYKGEKLDRLHPLLKAYEEQTGEKHE